MDLTLIGEVSRRAKLSGAADIASQGASYAGDTHLWPVTQVTFACTKHVFAHRERVGD